MLCSRALFDDLGLFYSYDYGYEGHFYIFHGIFIRVDTVYYLVGDTHLGHIARAGGFGVLACM